MDTKRVIIAIALSVAVVLAWNYVALKMGWVEQVPHNIAQETTQSERLDSSLASTTDPVRFFAQGESVVIETPLYKATLAVNGGILTSLSLEKYSTSATKEEPFQFIAPQALSFAPLGVLLNTTQTWGGGTWKASHSSLNLQEGEEKTLTLSADINGVQMTREFLFSADSYIIQERTVVHTQETQQMQIGYSLSVGELSTDAKYNVTKVAWDINHSIKTENDIKDLKKGQEATGNIQWIGIMDNYFLAAIAPMQTSSLTMRTKYEGDVFRVALYTPSALSSSSTPAVASTYYYIGPKSPQMLEKAPNELDSSITYGFFAFLSRPLILFLEFIYSFVHNYGIAIIILTCLIKLIFWPLSQKSYASMNKMKQLQPLVQELRDKYKDNKEEMNKAIMNLYKTYKVNPMGGCLPLLIQIPVFFALYEALLNSLSLRHAMFIEYLPFTNIIWLADLSTKDPLYITPIAMGISMFLQQLLTPQTGDPIQRKIMLIMPLVFTVFFLNFPSGLVLYWLSSNVISIIQQWILVRRKS
ncbi:MAG: membrane protein insertase YidC [Desulfovibrionaceae bacterium]|nr:membrane protein insertase YidC [Desulfovibrionaceae bacterium]